jgi:hypothetical protein
MVPKPLRILLDDQKLVRKLVKCELHVMDYVGVS